MKRSLAAILATSFAMVQAHASGPVAPDGWNGSNEPLLPTGQECCIPADLNGTGLVGGAFVFLSDDKTRFAVFALTYSSTKGQSKDVWHLLETHPIGQLSSYRVSTLGASPGSLPAVQVCQAERGCRQYRWVASRRIFIKSIPGKQ